MRSKGTWGFKLFLFCDSLFISFPNAKTKSQENYKY